LKTADCGSYETPAEEKSLWRIMARSTQRIPPVQIRNTMGNFSLSSSLRPQTLNHANEHHVQLYVDDRHLINVLCRYIGRALATGERGVVVATPNHRDKLSQQLLTHGFDLESLTRQGQYMTFDAADTLNSFMAGGHIDEQLFHEGAQAILERINQFSKKAVSRTCVFGEAVALLWAAGKPEDALRFENLWNRAVNGQPFSTLCAYPMMGFYSETDLDLFLRICSEHSRFSLSDKDYSDVGLPFAAQFPPEPREFKNNLISHEAELRFQLLVEAVKERAVFMIDLDGNISTWNPGAESMHGYAANEVVGRHVTFLDDKDDSHHDELKSKLATAIQKGLFEEEYWRTRKDGSRFFATFTITPTRNESGDLIGFAETIRLSRTIH
jgi:PAS domain S-box-containing protein